MIDEFTITFNGPGGATLDRASVTREDPARLNALWQDQAARVLPLWRGKPLFRLGAEGPILGWLTRVEPFLQGVSGPPILLGVQDSAGRFAVDVSAWEDPDADDEEMRKFLDTSTNSSPDLPDDHKFIDLRSIMRELTAGDAADAAAAKGCLEWHRTHQFCARCGAESQMDQGGWRRHCPSCGAYHFPRTDPVVIMLILHKDRALIGRQAVWPPQMYSLLAGFMEPGETIDDAVRRETKEETAIEVGRVGYLGCQPWPFPSNLMLGCVAEAETTVIKVDPQELEDAQWISRAKMAVILDGKHPRIAPPRRDAIARAILTDWVNGDIRWP